MNNNKFNAHATITASGAASRRLPLGRQFLAGTIYSLASMTVPGCLPDPRISVQQFQDSEAQAVLAASTQPTAELPVDRYLVKYRIGAGDVLDVTLTGLNNPTEATHHKVRVDPEGRVDLPLVGEVPVTDLEASQAEDVIKAAYVPAFSRQMTVNIDMLTLDMTQVVVTGAVVQPGLISLRRTDRNLLFAVLLAGGVSDAASGKVTLKRVRRPNETAAFDLRDPVQLDSALASPPLENGDIVLVEAAAPNEIFVGGLVNRPAPQSYPAGVRMTVLQAIAAAGGLRTDVYPHEGLLVRRVAGGNDVHVKLDLNRIQAGADDNLELAAGDILWMPETWDTKVLEFINRNIFLRGGVSVNYSVTGIEYLNRKHLQQASAGGRNNLADSFDPFGSLIRNAALQQLTAAPPPVAP